MLRKSYKTILSTETGFKKALKKVIYDIDERLKKITSGEALQDVFALKEHTHDSLYSVIGHVHDELYAPITHFHDDYVTKLGTAFNSERLGMRKANEYALATHTHSYIAYITNFAVPTFNTGTVTVHTDSFASDYYILDKNDKFTLQKLNKDNIVLNYELGEDNTQTNFTLLYWNRFTEEETHNVTVHLDNFQCNLGEEADLTTTVTDVNNNPVTEGKVDYTINFSED